MSSGTSFKIFAKRAITPHYLGPLVLTIADGRIAKVDKLDNKKKPNLTDSKKIISLDDGYLAPGFVDIHAHGAVGYDTMCANISALSAITRFHLTGGTTSIVLSTVSASEQEITTVLNTVKGVAGRSLGGSRILGVHLEGPYLASNKSGAHNKEQLRTPQRKEWQKYLKFHDIITQITIAPELDGAIPFIRCATEHGILMSIGHTDALEPTLKKAYDAGARHATHVFNAMGGMVKNGPFRIAGAIEFCLATDGLCCELIADGIHVPPTVMKLLFKAKSRDDICLITDAMAGAGMKAGTVFKAGGTSALSAIVTKDVAMTSDRTALSGSILTMIEAVKRAVTLCGVSIQDAVHMASLVPARQIRKDNDIGSIQPGKMADLVWFDDEFSIKGVWLGGDLLYLT
jgi:N-acetylglucosamine-6-phosphate deacetylase